MILNKELSLNDSISYESSELPHSGEATDGLTRHPPTYAIWVSF